MLKPSFSNRSFESRLLLTLAIVALVRTLIGTVQDLVGGVPWEGVLIDFLLLCIFVGLTYYAFHNKSYKLIHPYLGLVLVALLALLFIRSGGIEGTTEFNFFALTVVLTLFFHGRWQKILLVLSFVIFVYLSYSVYVKNPVFELLFIRNSWGYDNFLFTLIALTVLITHLQLLIEEEDKNLKAKNKELKEKVRLVSMKNAELNKQQLLLTQMNQRLLEKVGASRAYHEKRTKALQQYIEQNTKKIQLPIQNLEEAIHQVGSPYPNRYKEMLNTSMHDIHKVVEEVKATFILEQKLIFPTPSTRNNENKT